MKIKKQLWYIVIICAISGVMIPRFLASKPEIKRTGRSDNRRNMITDVSVYIVKHKSVTDKIISTGSIMPNEQVDLKSEASGRIVMLNIKEGTAVSKGQLLVKINDSDLQAQLLKTNAALKLAQDREKRQKLLLDKEVISTEDYQSSLKDLESCKADIALITSQIQKTEIRSPFGGTIGLRSISEGAYISVGTQIASLISLTPLKIDFSVPERYYGNIRPGTKLTFTIQASTKLYHAHVYAVEPKIDETTRSAQARAICDDPDSSVAPGFFARVELVISTKPDAIAVPSQSLVPDIIGQRVYCIRQGKAVATPVNTGIRTETTVEITGGLSVGDSVVTTGVVMLRPNIAVNVTGVEE
ncbi:MAG TPA: efflux RND transporter periplasmic adaptor subunit [Chitinispirillaceae bacterium]|nr:efflux RND transporter periplasmic adaptor subunit [Chitinispirillaceae bacterium]